MTSIPPYYLLALDITSGVFSSIYVDELFNIYQQPTEETNHADSYHTDTC